MTVLLLRGPRPPASCGPAPSACTRSPTGAGGEVLRRLAALPTPLVRELERRPGQQDRRWVHLLGPVEAGLAEQAAVAPRGCRPRDRAGRGGGRARRQGAGGVRRGGGGLRRRASPTSWTHKPFDRWLLERVAALADGLPVADVGTGPGHVAAYLATAGADVTGFDLSPGMVAQARERFPQLTFAVGDLTGLLRPPPRPGWGAITGVVLPGAPRRLRARAGRGVPGAGAGARRLARLRPARREPRSGTRRAAGPSRSTSTSCCTTRRGAGRRPGGRAGRRRVVPARAARRRRGRDRAALRARSASHGDGRLEVPLHLHHPLHVAEAERSLTAFMAALTPALAVKT